MTRELVAFVEVCEDDCMCHQVILAEFVDGEEVERIHEGLFLADPSPAEYELLEEELREIAHKHRLRQDEDDPLRWLRQI